MIHRIVKLTLDPKEVESFLAMFAEKKERIRNVEGCLHLQLLQHTRYEKCTFYTEQVGK